MRRVGQMGLTPGSGGGSRLRADWQSMGMKAVMFPGAPYLPPAPGPFRVQPRPGDSAARQALGAGTRSAAGERLVPERNLGSSRQKALEASGPTACALPPEVEFEIKLEWRFTGDVQFLLEVSLGL